MAFRFMWGESSDGDLRKSSPIYLFMSCLCNIVKTNACFTVGFLKTRMACNHRSGNVIVCIYIYIYMHI